jgi:hypothetical protein
MVPLRALPRTPVLRVLLPALAVSFAIGALTHAGVRLPLGVATIDEPTIVPAAIVEAIIAVAFAVATYAELATRPFARLALALALRVGIGGVLLGMLALALGRGTRTELNDVFHVVALIAMLLLAKLSSRSPDGRSCWSPRSRLPRRAT